MNNLTGTLATVTGLLFATSSAFALPYEIKDVYWGAGVSGSVNTGANAGIAALSGDVYGAGYDISKMTVEVANKTLRVEIFSDTYFSKWLSGDAGFDFPGALFLSTNGWNPVGSENYPTDGMKVGDGEQWEYVVTLTDVEDKSIKNSLSNVYAISDGRIINGYDGTRTAQEALFTPNAGASSLGSGSWQYAEDTKSLVITMSLAKLIDWDPTKDLGLHWTMACANDVVEGRYPGAPVPEPNTLVLFGAGLLGLAGMGRRRAKK